LAGFLNGSAGCGGELLSFLLLGTLLKIYSLPLLPLPELADSSGVELSSWHAFSWSSETDLVSKLTLLSWLSWICGIGEASGFP
jgi:hypothetical protein